MQVDSEAHNDLMQIWQTVALLSRMVPAPPQTNDVLSYQLNLCASKQTKTDLEVKIAMAACKQIEETYKDSIVGTIDMKRKDHVFEVFERQVRRVTLAYQNDPSKLQNLIYDEQRQTFPFFTVLLLFKAGLTAVAQDYCSVSTHQAVRQFGSGLLAKYIQHKGTLPRSEVEHYRAQWSNDPTVDTCRVALVSLLTGDYQDQQLTKELMIDFFEEDLASQLWFFLKLASYVHPPEQESSFFINTHKDVRQPYFLSQLQDLIAK